MLRRLRAPRNMTIVLLEGGYVMSCVARLFGRILPIAAVLPLALTACSQSTASDPRTAAPLVRAAIVEGAAPASRSFTGTVAARVQSDLGFRLSGKVLVRLV